jgi:hypothetical protein
LKLPLKFTNLAKLDTKQELRSMEVKKKVFCLFLFVCLSFFPVQHHCVEKTQFWERALISFIWHKQRRCVVKTHKKSVI